MEGNVRKPIGTCFETAADYIFLLDMEGRMADVGEETSLKLGFAPGELCSRSFFSLFPPARQLEAVEKFCQALVGPHPSFDIPLARRDGTPIDAETKIKRFRLGGDDSIFVACTEHTSPAKGKLSVARGAMPMRHLSDFLPVAFWTMSADWRQIIYMGPGFEKIYGRPVSQIYANPSLWLSAMEPEDRKRVLAHLDSDSAHQCEYECRILRPDGSRRWVRVLQSPVCGIGGDIAMYSGVMEDISDRKEIENRARETEARYKALVESLNVGVISGTDKDLLQINNTLANLLGYKSSDELKGMNPDQLFSDPDEARSLREKTASRGYVRDAEVSFKTKEGKDIWVSLNSRAQYDAGNGEVLYNSVVEDITDRRRTEMALRESEERYRVLFNGVMNGFALQEVIFDEDGTPDDYRLLEINPAFEKLTGLTALSSVGKTLREVSPSRFRDWSPAYASVVMSGQPVHFESFSGPGQCYQITAFSPKKGHIVTVVADISERKRAEKELKQSQDKLRALAAHIQSVREDERSLISREIHDGLGGVLTGLKFELNVMESILSEPQRAGDTELMLKKVRSMTELVVSTMKEVQRIALILRPPVLDDLGFTEAIRWLTQDFQERTEISCRVSLNVTNAELDRDRSTAVFRILQEALTNVARHSGAKLVLIDLRREKDNLILEVKDNGKGATMKKLSDIKSLGLIGMRERAHVFGGEVDIASQRGKGTLVRVKIPLK